MLLQKCANKCGIAESFCPAWFQRRKRTGDYGELCCRDWVCATRESM
jgi:hypothetical protein